MTERTGATPDERNRTTTGTTEATDATATTDTSTTKPMTDADTTDTDAQPARQQMKEIDHTPPVGGATRSFERRHEGRPVRADGGARDEEGADPEEGADAEEGEDETTTDGGFTQKMKEMDHTPPVDGANRTFERGKDNDDEDNDDEDDVRE